jgi:hypothetical protein
VNGIDAVTTGAKVLSSSIHAHTRYGPGGEVVVSTPLPRRFAGIVHEREKL